MKHPVPSRQILRAQALRREPTRAERAMWRLLREALPEGRWRRQVPIHCYITDFASHRWKLVVEIDGGQHSPAADALRTRRIAGEGYCVVRFWNNQVLENPDGCVQRLIAAVLPPPDCD